MVIVTGTARSRTSMTMRILDLFGHSFVGTKFVNESFEKNHNHAGIYEKEGDSIYGYKGPVVNSSIKLLLTALFPNRINGMRGTSVNVLKEATSLLCLRKPYEIARSVKKIYPDVPITPNYILWEYCSFLSWLDYNRWYMDNLYTIDTDGYFNEPVETMKSLAQVVGCPKGQAGLEEALMIVDPSKTIISDFGHEWNEEFKKHGELVDELHSLFLNNNFEKAMEMASNHVKGCSNVIL